MQKQLLVCMYVSIYRKEQPVFSNLTLDRYMYYNNQKDAQKLLICSWFSPVLLKSAAVII